ncbi:MAG TPA: hypothetical protein VFZ25_04955 [Chloroflexota bacterium]|nr:hypothetical protein [Chloroflexota bacterium]
MTVEYVSIVKGRGTVAAGTLVRGGPTTGEIVIIEAEDRQPVEALLTGVEMGSRSPKIGILL